MADPRLMPPGPAGGVTTSDAVRDARARMQEALAHPLRWQIIELLTTSPATARELAAATGRSRSAVSHHLRVLEECQAVQRTPSEGPGGTVYRSIVRSMVRSDEGWGEYPLELRREIFATDLRSIEQHTREALIAGGFDRDDAHVSWTLARLDEPAYAALAALLDETLERVLAITAGAELRLEQSGSAAPHLETEVVLMHFLRGGRAAAGDPCSPPTDVQRAFRLHEELGEEIPRALPNWSAVAALARELVEVAEELAAR